MVATSLFRVASERASELSLSFPAPCTLLLLRVTRALLYSISLMHQSNPIVPILPQLHCGASAYHVGPWEGVSASFAWPGARAFAYPGASPELLVCSQSLYFLFKVRWARLIKYKPRGIYYRQRKRVGVEEETRSRKQRLCTVYRPFDTHVVSYPIITKHGGFYRKHKQIGRLVHLSRMRKTWGVWELEMVVVRLFIVSA